jgi:hypothetical protein
MPPFTRTALSTRPALLTRALPRTRAVPGIRTVLTLLTAAAMTIGIAVPAAAAAPASFHFVRGSVTTTPGSVCVDAYVEPAVGVPAVTLDIALNGVVRDSVTSTLSTSSRGSHTDSIKYSRCLDAPSGSVQVTAVATASPSYAGGRPVATQVLDTTVKVTAAPRPTVPTAPAKPALRAVSATAIKVSWGAVSASDAVTGYEVRVSRGGSVVRTVKATGTSTTISGLKRSASYSVSVRARNAVGASAASRSASIRLAQPAKPQKPAVGSTSATSAKITWKAPKSTGGPAILGYQVRVLRGSKVVKTIDVAADKRSAALSGLDGRTRYSVDVRARNVVGASARSAKGTFTTKGWSAEATWAAKEYGTFGTVTFRGSGNKVLTLPRGAKAGILAARHTGASTFSIEVRDSAGGVVDQSVTHSGAYSGSTVFGMDSWRGTPRTLKITASGSWTIEVRAIRTAAALPKTGRSDGVYLVRGDAKRLALTHSGHSNFSVYRYASGPKGRAHLINAFGGYRGNVSVPKGPAVVEIVADGKWTAKRP